MNEVAATSPASPTHRLAAWMLATACALLLVIATLIAASPQPQAGDQAAIALWSELAGAETEVAQNLEGDSDCTDRELVLLEAYVMPTSRPPRVVPTVPHGQDQFSPSPPHRPPPALA